MAIWVFMDYVSPAGTNLIRKWSQKVLSLEERDELETLLGVLAKQKQWQSQDFHTISGYTGLGEIRWKSAQGTPLRIAGIKGAISGQYILLIGFSHKGRVYKPPKPFDTAMDRKRTLDNKTGNIREHEEDD